MSSNLEQTKELILKLQPTRKTGISEAVTRMAPEIMEALTRGVSREQIIETLKKEQGIEIAPSTLSSILSKFRKTNQTERKSK